jgi:hypothetical protein
MPPSLNNCPIFLYLTRCFYFVPFAITFQITAHATNAIATNFITPSYQMFLDPEMGVMLCPLAYLWCHMLTCTYIPLLCVPPDCLYRTCLSIQDSMDFAIILILSSYVLSRVTVLTFLISPSFSHSCCPSYSESPPLYPICMSQFLLFAYDSFYYNYYTILRICQLITEQLMHRLQLVWLRL